MLPDDDGARRPTRVLFLAWGPSIHMQRRIGLFADDPGFSVAVASTFDFSFSNAKNILLTDATAAPASAGRRPFFHRIRVLRVAGILWTEIKKALKDIGILKKTVEHFKPQVIFLQTLLYPCYLAYFLPRSIPVIITFWNGDVIWWAKRNGMERLFKKQITLRGVRRASAITANSAAVMTTCKTYGAPPDRIHFIRYPGVDLDRFKPVVKETEKKKLGISGRRMLFCPRDLAPYQNTWVVIQSIKTVAQRHPDVVYVFVVDESNEKTWQKLLQENGAEHVSRHIQKVGHLAWENMPSYYGAAEAVVSISSKDSLPNCMLEAMACGVPVVMGDIQPVRDFITDKVNGLIVPLEDPAALAKAICMIFDDQEQTRKIVQESLGLIRRELDSKVNCEIVKNLVHRVASGKGTQSHAEAA
jgi:glycosyltransferase involved in cell wall biosynthesis